MPKETDVVAGGAAFPSDGASNLRTDVPVVVMNTHHTGLGIARNLGAQGIRVVGLTSIRESPGNNSKHLNCRLAPDSLEEQPALLACLRRLADELGCQSVLLPTRDHDIHFINRHRVALEALFIIPFASPEIIDRVMNKDRLFEAARRAGIDVPRGVTLTSLSDLALARSLRFPCVCKPLYASQWRHAKIWDAAGRQKAVKIATFAELQKFYAGITAMDPVATVQEWIPGTEKSLQIFGSYCGADHEVKAYFTARKRLQYPELIGTGIAVEALPLPELEQPSRRLLRELRFHGIAEIEYKVDDRDGRLNLIEVNPRHWDQHRLGTIVSVNLSEALYREMTGQPHRTMKQSERHGFWIAEAEFARHLARCLLGKASWRSARVGFGGLHTWSVFDVDDPKPFLSLTGFAGRMGQ